MIFSYVKVLCAHCRKLGIFQMFKGKRFPISPSLKERQWIFWVWLVFFFFLVSELWILLLLIPDRYFEMDPLMKYDCLSLIKVIFAVDWVRDSFFFYF